jgi:flagella basal body P-ring formation protein FlgA
MKSKKILYFLLMSIYLFAFQSAWARSFQSHESIKEAALEYVHNMMQEQQQKVTIKVGRLDSRLKLKQCNKLLEAFTPPGSKLVGNSTIGVRCEDGKKPWTMYISVTIKTLKNVVIASRSISKGDILSKFHLSVVEKEIGNSYMKYFSSTDGLMGKEITRNINAGEIIKPNLVKNPLVIKRGELVSIISRKIGLEVRSIGKALQNGALGDTIRVTNTKSKKTIDGVVIGSGKVQVNR